MEELLTEEQQAEKVRSWLQENAIYLIAGVVLGLGALFGNTQWQRYKENQAERASAVYDAFVLAVRTNQSDQAETSLATLVDEFGSSPYVSQARLLMARVELDRNQPEKSAGYLREVIAKAQSDEIRNVARLRLARVLVFMEKPEEALKVLVDPGSAAFAPAFHDVRGDVYFAMGKLDAARSEYQLALEGDSAGLVVDQNYLRAKLDDLGGAGSAAIAAEAP